MSHLLMFDFGVLSEPHMRIVATDGITLPMLLINVETGAETERGEVTFPGNVELHFAASHKQIFEGLWYMQKRDEDGIWRCTCLECRPGWCPHLSRFSSVVA